MTIYIERRLPRQAIDILKSVGFDNIIMFDHEIEHTKEMLNIFVNNFIKKNEKTIILFSYMDANYYLDLTKFEQLFFDDEIIVFNKNCLEMHDFRKPNKPSTYVYFTARRRKIPIAVYRFKDTYVVQLNDIGHHCDVESDNAKIEIIAQLASLLARSDDKLNREISTIVNLVKTINTDVRMIPITEAKIDSGIPGVEIKLSVGEKIYAKVNISGMKILGVAKCGIIVTSCVNVYECPEKPLLYAYVELVWQKNGVFEKMLGKGYAVLDGVEALHENIEYKEELGPVCGGTWKPPNLDLTRPIDEQIRRIANDLVNVLQYPNVASKYHEGIGTMLLERGGCERIKDWAADNE